MDSTVKNHSLIRDLPASELNRIQGGAIFIPVMIAFGKGLLNGAGAAGLVLATRKLLN